MLVVSVVAAIVGVALAVCGVVVFEAGKGGYGMGPFPMIPVPRDNGLMAVGLALFVLGWLIVIAALDAGGWFA